MNEKHYKIDYEVVHYKIDYEVVLERVVLKLGQGRALDLSIEIMEILKDAGLSGDESLAMVMFTGEAICCAFPSEKKVMPLEKNV